MNCPAEPRKYCYLEPILAGVTEDNSMRKIILHIFI